VQHLVGGGDVAAGFGVDQADGGDGFLDILARGDYILDKAD